jgi:hypothetical protein
VRHAFGYTVTDAVTTAPRTLTRGQARLLAFTAGATCANLYYAQPLLPDLPPEIETGYAAQLREALSFVRTQPVLRWRGLIGACGFGSFSAFWTTVSFLLARPPYDFNQLEIGLFALAGAAGALLSAFGGAHLGWLALALLVAGTLFMDAAAQSSNLLGQSVIYGLLPQARSRITAVYMTTMFIGGALGSWAGAHAYERWGWAGAPAWPPPRFPPSGCCAG